MPQTTTADTSLATRASVWLVKHRAVLAMGGLALALAALAGWGLSTVRSSPEEEVWRSSATVPPGMRWLDKGQVELGTFDLSVFDPIEQRSVNVHCRAVARTTLADAEAFERLMRGHGRAVRAQVESVLRGATRKDLLHGDPQRLGRMITARVNRDLGCEVFRSIDVQDLSVFEPKL